MQNACRQNVLTARNFQMVFHQSNCWSGSHIVMQVQESNFLQKDMQNAVREKMKVEYKLLSFGWEPRNQVSEGIKRQKVKDALPHKGKSKLKYGCSCMAAHVKKKRKSAPFLIIMRKFSGWEKYLFCIIKWYFHVIMIYFYRYKHLIIPRHLNFKKISWCSVTQRNTCVLLEREEPQSTERRFCWKKPR